MTPSVTLPLPAAARDGSGELASVRYVPWYVWMLVASVLSSTIGSVWDIAWHKSIGRDSFWTPAHVAIYLCGVTAGIACGFLILHTTFAPSSRLRASSVSMWGFRAPLGAFLAAWGGVAMLASAPFDNWWHDAYGLDVRVLSPPHVVLALGILTIRVGALFLIAGELARAPESGKRWLRGLLFYVFAFLSMMLMGLSMEYTVRPYMHGARFYAIIGALAPLWMAAAARATGHRWGFSIIAGCYTAFACGCVWLMPLVPAEPKLGPVYQSVTHLIPPEFPMLLIFPALATDFVRHRLSRVSAWMRSLICGGIFTGVFLAVQWPFAMFLMSPASRSAFFGTHYFPFFIPPDSPYVRSVFVATESGNGAFALVLLLAALLCGASMRTGELWGGSLSRIQR